MRQGFRPILEPPSHRRVEPKVKQPVLFLVLAVGVVGLVVIMFGVSAWNLYEHQFNQQTYVFQRGDEVALSQVSGDLSTTFCDSYRVSLEVPGEVFLLSRPAQVNLTAVDVVSVELGQQSYREFNIKYMYLLQGSLVNVTACRTWGSISPDAQIVLIQGDSNLRQWRRNSFCEVCVLARRHVPQGAFCSGPNRQQARLVFQVQENDKHFLVVYNGRPRPRHHLLDPFSIRLMGSIARTRFDISMVEKSCYIFNGSFCFFELPWMSHRDIIVRFNGEGGNKYTNTLTTNCQTRVIFWVGLFGLVPFTCIVLTLTLLGCYFRKRTVRNVIATQECQPDERARLLPKHHKQYTSPVPQNEDQGRMTIQNC